MGALLALLWSPGVFALDAPAGGATAAQIVAAIQAPVFPARVFDVREFGARGDGVADDRPAILAAIRACNVAGGGRVLLPPGLYFSAGPVHLQSHVDLHLAAGATLRFTDDPARYLPVVLTRWEGTECFNYSPLIYVRNATDVAVTGAGTIDGTAKNSFARWKPQQGPDQLRLRAMGAEGVPLPERVFGAGHWLRPGLMQFYGCTRVLVEGVTIKDAPFWVIHPVFCRDVTVRGVTVESANANNDGCDPDSSVNVLIEDCVFRTGDDAVAIKSGRDAEGWRSGARSENIVVRRCVLASQANGLCIGSEMSGGVRNVFLEDCQVLDAGAALCFKANLDRGGEVAGIHVRGITVQRARRALVEFTTAYHGYRGGQHPPSFRDFVIADVTADTVDGPAIYAVGVPEARLENIRLQNITVARAAAPAEIRHTRGLTLENVRINGVELPPALSSEHP
ncbi:MAG: glycoside hydrolase family 28 protein [Opitutae bacterium]|nr:glycoside hydrolase family 28 protein [Opitutae bacterium]